MTLLVNITIRLGTCQKSSRFPDCCCVLAFFHIFIFGSGNRLLISAPLFSCLSASALCSLSHLWLWRVHGEQHSGVTLCAWRVSQLPWCWCGAGTGLQSLAAGGGIPRGCSLRGGTLRSGLCPFTRAGRVSGLPAVPCPHASEMRRCPRGSWDGGCRIQALEPSEDPASLLSHQGKLQVQFAAPVQRDAGRLSLWMGWCPGVLEQLYSEGSGCSARTAASCREKPA